MKNKIAVTTILCCLVLVGCGVHKNNDVTILDMQDGIPSFDSCITKAKSDVTKRDDVQSVEEQQKQDGNVGLYMARIKLKTGGVLQQLCEIGRHDTTATYALMGVGPGIKPGVSIGPGLQLPGGFTLLKAKRFLTRSECEAEAAAEITKQPDVKSVDNRNDMSGNYRIIYLKNGRALVQSCQVVNQQRTNYYLMGNVIGASP